MVKATEEIEGINMNDKNLLSALEGERNFYNGRLGEVYDLAIELLKYRIKRAENIEQGMESDEELDLIRRDDIMIEIGEVKKWYEKNIYKKDDPHDIGYIAGLVRGLALIRKASSVKLHNTVKGKWIKEVDETDPERQTFYKCSNCGNLKREIYYRSYKNGNYDDLILGDKFCNKCGADMSGTLCTDETEQNSKEGPLFFDNIEPLKHGYWIDSIQCSECGWMFIDDVLCSLNYVGFRFCPNCGAKMEKKDE